MRIETGLQSGAYHPAACAGVWPLPRCGRLLPPPPGAIAPASRVVPRDTVDFARTLQRENRRDITPTYSEYLEQRNKRDPEPGLPTELRRFDAPAPSPGARSDDAPASTRPAYAGPRLGDISTAGPIPPRAETLPPHLWRSVTAPTGRMIDVLA